jgi:hypothetical protein
MTIKKEVVELQPSTLETIDSSFFDWVDQGINIFCTTNTGWRKVPVIWAGQERSSQIKKYKDLRDSDGTLIFPIITIQRKTVTKDPNRKGPYWGNVPQNDKDGGSIAINRRIKSDKTAGFRNEQQYRRTGQLNFVTKKNVDRSIVYETLFIPMPVHLKIVYEVAMKSQYQQQMNEMLQSFETKTLNVNYFRFGKNGHMYEGFMPSDVTFENNTDALEEEERIFKTVLDIETIGYVYSQDKNHPTPKIVVKEGIAEVKLKVGKECVIIGEEEQWEQLK